MQFLLDTNIVSDLVRNQQGKVWSRLTQIDQSVICTSIVVTAELLFGAKNRGSKALTERVQEVIRRLHVIPLDVPVDAVYAEMRLDLERRGEPIGANDLLIAAQCVAGSLTLVSDNEREFSKVAGLKLVNWLR